MSYWKYRRITGFVSTLVLGFTVGGCDKLLTKAETRTPEPADTWFVVKISDGDTIKVRQTNGQEKKIRFCGIDSPEKSQPLGQKSKANLQKLINEADGQVLISEVEKDRYGRTVAEVFTSVQGKERSLNEEQLSSGNAYYYAKYAAKCPNNEVFARAEAIAKQKRLGVWSGDFEKPWDYRKRVRND
ncbi:thermonuclease family protein [Scytonema sp. UIC 10036]|uniref:thermonuclease family protein n=1 Tax=Scytonema sp. UIC 10036 TaxID=2304196 RepID=UPI0012DA37F3|nr:thermonuclease family protein [Scytonema sp. UIC 10036]MUG92738.1 thermonuclease family protein [Scytonema sp. UIC 10036]